MECYVKSYGRLFQEHLYFCDNEFIPVVTHKLIRKFKNLIGVTDYFEILIETIKNLKLQS